MLLALLNRGMNPMDSSQKHATFRLEERQNAVFAVFSENALIQNRLRIILKCVLKKPLQNFRIKKKK